MYITSYEYSPLVTGQGPDIRAGADPGLLGAEQWLEWADQMAGGGVEVMKVMIMMMILM